MTELTERLTSAIADRYQIEKHIGQGGMATVYLAHDIKHDRNVALKVLRPELAAVIGAERFLQEIKVTANLQHPNILPLYDSGEADSFLYYVMPFIEGDTLRDKLNREKQLGIEDAIEITKCVAAALDYAHRNDVIHRDIKPENILLHDGQALVADFGIALAVSAASGNRLTETGLSIGTPHYMSPEQAMGDRELDARSDVYSLGAMMYEMLAGDPPYTGSTAQAIVARVITEDPRPLTLQRRTAPPHVAASVHKALNKLPADRFASAAEFADALTKPGVIELPVTPTAEAPPAPGKRNWPFLGASALAVGAVALLLWNILGPEPPPRVSRFTIALPAGQGITDRFSNTIALSPDGSRFVYVGPGESGAQLWLREMDQLEATPIAGTESALGPFFSPDGQSVAYYTTIFNTPLRVVSLAGGPPLTLATGGLFSVGGSWGDDGYLYTVQGAQGLDPIVRVSSAGGDLEIVAVPDTAGGREYFWPDVLPGGKAVLFTKWLAGSGGNEDAEIAVASLGTGEVKVLLQGVTARYAEPGFIVYTRADGALLAVPFDSKKLEVTGPSTPLIEGILTKDGGASEFAISKNGSLLYLTGEAGAEELVWVERDGGERSIDPDFQENVTSVSLSPEGNRIALSYTGKEGENIWIYDLVQATVSRLTFEGRFNQRAEWMAGGEEITFVSDAGAIRQLNAMPADGSGSARSLVSSEQRIQEASWSRDGRFLVYRVGPGGGTLRDILYVEQGDTTPRTFLATEYDELNPKLSPDGKWLAYVSNESGRDEVYVRPFPGPGGRWQISTDGGIEPLWSRDGGELFYRSLNAELVSAQVTTGASFSVGARTPLFSVSEYDSDRNHTMYDISPDDQRFLMVKQLGGSRDVVVVLNWFTEVLQRIGR